MEVKVSPSQVESKSAGTLQGSTGRIPELKRASPSPETIFAIPICTGICLIAFFHFFCELCFVLSWFRTVALVTHVSLKGMDILMPPCFYTSSLMSFSSILLSVYRKRLHAVVFNSSSPTCLHLNCCFPFHQSNLRFLRYGNTLIVVINSFRKVLT